MNSKVIGVLLTFLCGYPRNVGHKFETYAEVHGERYKESDVAGAADAAGKAYQEHLKQMAFWRSMKDERNAKRVAEIKQHIEDLKKNPAVAHIDHLLNADEE